MDVKWRFSDPPPYRGLPILAHFRPFHDAYRGKLCRYNVVWHKTIIKLEIGVKNLDFWQNELFSGRIPKIREMSGRPILRHFSHFWVPKWPKWRNTSIFCLKEGKKVPLRFQDGISLYLTYTHGHVVKNPENAFLCHNFARKSQIWAKFGQNEGVRG